MKKILCFVICCLTLFCLSACAPSSRQAQIEKEVGLDVSAGTVVTDYDTHSGNGDGLTLVALTFPDDQLQQHIAEDAAWKKLPCS